MIDSLQVYITVHSLHCYYIGHCPLSEVYLIYTTFQGLAVLPSSGDCNYTDRILLILCMRMSVTARFIHKTICVPTLYSEH